MGKITEVASKIYAQTVIVLMMKITDSISVPSGEKITSSILVIKLVLNLGRGSNGEGQWGVLAGMMSSNRSKFQSRRIRWSVVPVYCCSGL